MHLGYILKLAFIAGSVMAAPVKLAPRRLSCSNLHLVCLVGTTEKEFGIVCGPLRDDLASAVPGMPYNTDPEYGATVEEGARNTEKYIADQAAACPNQRFVLSGYSKGAMVIHQMNLAPALKNKVLSIAVFGDPTLKSGGSPFWPINQPSVDTSPRDGSAPTQNIASFCNQGDEFCDPWGSTLEPHLAYGKDGSTVVAANFVKVKI